MLVGRRDERALIERLLQGARQGSGDTLAITGPPGIGKTTLLDHAARSADSMQVLHARGVAPEQQLPYAVLGWLLRPVSAWIDSLPAGQNAAVRSALDGSPPPGTASAGEPGQTAAEMGRAIFTLLTLAAQDMPVLVLIDDAQWADQASMDALAFAARRTRGEAIVMLLAARHGSPALLPAGIETINLEGLGKDDAAALVGQLGPDIATDVRQRLVAAAEGNPSALLELPGTLSRDQQEGRASLAGLPFGTQAAHSRVLTEFHHLVEEQAPGAQALLLVAAAEPRAGTQIVLRAAATLGASADDLAIAERSGLLLAHTDSIELVHPLARAAAYRHAPLAQRLQAHQALADELRPIEPARAAWHRSLAVTGKDDAVAAELEAVARYALQRGHRAVASAAFERAGQLVTGSHLQAKHLADAAEASLLVGLDDRATHLADEAQRFSADPATRSQVTLLRAALHDQPGDHQGRHRTYTEVADEVAMTTPAAAVELLNAAAEQAWYLSDPAAARAAVARLDTLDVPERAEQPGRQMLARVIATIAERDYPHALPQLPNLSEGGAHLLHQGPVVEDLALLRGGHGRPPSGIELSPGTSLSRAYLHALDSLLSGDLAEVARTSEETQASLAAEHDPHPATCCLWHRTDRAHWLSRFRGIDAWLAALAGDPERCRSLAESSFAHAVSPLPTPATAMATWALALLDLGLGRHDEALARLAKLRPSQAGHLILSLHTLPDLVEAGVRAGRLEVASGALDLLALLAEHSDRPWVDGVLARCRGLTSAPADAEQHYTAAVASAGLVGQPYEMARTQLSYGEWLRRSARRREAREQLLSAWEIFARLGARPWAERAESELRASGYRVTPTPPPTPTPTPATGTSDPGSAGVDSRSGDVPPPPTRSPVSTALEALSPRELEIVKLAATGATNREIGAKLYLSPRTVGYHLYKAYPKLGVTSRHELARLFPASSAGA